ncbi:MAG: hypothetical protein JXB03_11485 [Spirochaetales bacterium]|nr:hypothetical protein [Spirochaetales bacterium]
MTYAYNYRSFIMVFSALVLLSAVIVKAVLSFTNRPRVYSVWGTSAAVFLLSWSLGAICPFDRTRTILRFLHVLSLFPLCYTTVILVFGARILRVSGRFRLYEKLIIDNLREHIVLFDSHRRVVSLGRENILPGVFSINEIPYIQAGHEFQDLGSVITGHTAASGTLYSQEKVWQYRFYPLGRTTGSLLTFLDITREQELIDELKQVSRSLSRKKRLLVSLQDMNTEKQIARLHEHIIKSIDAEVRKNMHHFLSLLEKGTSCKELIAAAEGSLREVRHLVTELSPWQDPL